jgi:hypothetical protein
VHQVPPRLPQRVDDVVDEAHLQHGKGNQMDGRYQLVGRQGASAWVLE